MIRLIGHGLVAYVIDLFWHQDNRYNNFTAGGKTDTNVNYMPQLGTYNENHNGLESILKPVNGIRTELDRLLELFDDRSILAAEAYPKLASVKSAYNPEYCAPTSLSYPVRGNEKFKQELAAGHFEFPLLSPAVLTCLPERPDHVNRFCYFGKGDRSLRTFERGSFHTSQERFDFINGTHLGYSGSKVTLDYHGFSYKGIDFVLVLLENDTLESQDYLSLMFGFVKCIWRHTVHGGGGDSGNAGTPIAGYENQLVLCSVKPYVYDVLNFGQKQIVVLDVRKFSGIGQYFIMKRNDANVAIQSFRVIKKHVLKEV